MINFAITSSYLTYLRISGFDSPLSKRHATEAYHPMSGKITLVHPPCPSTGMHLPLWDRWPVNVPMLAGGVNDWQQHGGMRSDRPRASRNICEFTSWQTVLSLGFNLRFRSGPRRSATWALMRTQHWRGRGTWPRRRLTSTSWRYTWSGPRGSDREEKVRQATPPKDVFDVTSNCHCCLCIWRHFRLLSYGYDVTSGCQRSSPWPCYLVGAS